MYQSYRIVFLFFLLVACTNTDDQKNYELKNINTTEAYVETIWNQKNLDSIDTFFSKQFIRKVNTIDMAVDSSELIANISVLFTAFPDLHLDIEYLIATDNKVFMNWTIIATNRGNFGDHPATGKKVKISGMSRFDFNEDGKITFENIYYNELSLMQQLGHRLTNPIM